MRALKARVNPFKRGLELRKTIIKDGRVLCVNFENTVQKQDLTKGYFKDEATGTYPYRAKINLKLIDDEYRSKKGLPALTGLSKEELHEVIREALNSEFDIPLWFLRKAGDELESIRLYDCAVIYQVKGCNFHDGSEAGGCVYCFVDNASNSGNPEGGVYLSVENIIDGFQIISKKLGSKTIRTSGGEPTLVLDHILALYQEMAERGIPILAQFDTNLSTGRLIEHLEDVGEYPKDVLRRIAEFDPKVLVAFKGTSDESIRQNVQADCNLECQIYSFRLFVKAGIDVYPCIYNPDPNTLESFINRLESEFENFLLKTHINPLKVYSPTRERIARLAEEMAGEGIEITAEELLSCYMAEWESNFECSCEIMDRLCRQRYGVGYKEVERPGVVVKVKA